MIYRNAARAVTFQRPTWRVQVRGHLETEAPPSVLPPSVLSTVELIAIIAFIVIYYGTTRRAD